MPFSRPTLTQLQAQAAADVATAVPGADALLRFSNLGILGKVLAAAVNGLYGFLDWIARQAVPFTATGEYLEGWAALKNVVRKPATAAGVVAPIGVTFTGADTSVLPIGIPIQRGDGLAYVTTGAGTVVAGTVTVSVAAVAHGSGGTAALNQTMNLGVAIPGVNSGGLVTAVGSAGTDIESDDALRTRMLQVYQSPPMGGSAGDYVTWALQVAGVTRAWCAPLEEGDGTVAIYTMWDVAEAGSGGFPQGTNGTAALETRAAHATGDQLAVADYIYPRRPVTALVYSKAPTANTCSFTLAGIPGASAPTKTAIAAAVAAVLLNRGAPGGTVDGEGNPAGPVDLSYIESAIAAIAGTAGFVITVVACTAGAVTPGGDGNIASNAGAIPVLGAITYV